MSHIGSFLAYSKWDILPRRLPDHGNRKRDLLNSCFGDSRNSRSERPGNLRQIDQTKPPKLSAMSAAK